MQNVIKVILTGMILVCFTSSAFCGDSPQSDEWEFYTTPYFWAPSVDFDSTISGQTAPIDLSFTDILDDFDVFGLSTHTEAWKGRLGIIFDGNYIDLDTDPTIRVGPVRLEPNVTITDFTVDLGVGYMFDATDKLRIAPYGGMRYHYLKQEVKLEVDIGPIRKGTTLGTSYDWLEPLVGIKIYLELTDSLSFLTKANASGFGVGSASDLTWNVWAAFDYKFSDKHSLKLGYRYYDMDYSRGSGAEEFGFDGHEDGPLIGFTFKL
jgi:hypothetical protein